MNCATLLERLPPPWLLDRAEITKNCLKYRRGAGEVIIVNHRGSWWWDAQSDAKGDVFDLAQHLDPGLNFGEVRKLLRPFIGLTPAFPEASRRWRRDFPDATPAERWEARPPLRPASPGWRYLTLARGLPDLILKAATAADVLREGAYGSPWFAQRDAAGRVTHVEIRAQNYKGSVAGGVKTLFRFPGGDPPFNRLEDLRANALPGRTAEVGQVAETALFHLVMAAVGNFTCPGPSPDHSRGKQVQRRR